MSAEVMNDRWSEAEDIKLFKLVNMVGFHNWIDVSAHFTHHGTSSCRQRWLYLTDPSRRWNSREDIRLLRAFNTVGPRYDLICPLLPGRNLDSCTDRCRYLAELFGEVEGKPWSYLDNCEDWPAITRYLDTEIKKYTPNDEVGADLFEPGFPIRGIIPPEIWSMMNKRLSIPVEKPGFPEVPLVAEQLGVPRKQPADDFSAITRNSNTGSNVTNRATIENMVSVAAKIPASTATSTSTRAFVLTRKRPSTKRSYKKRKSTSAKKYPLVVIPKSVYPSPPTQFTVFQSPLIQPVYPSSRSIETNLPVSPIMHLSVPPAQPYLAQPVGVANYNMNYHNASCCMVQYCWPSASTIMNIGYAPWVQAYWTLPHSHS